MVRSTSVSTRLRVTAPLLLAATALIPRAATAATTTPQREDPAARQSNPLAAMLALVPVDVVGSIDNAQIATFADMAAQLAAGGIATPSSIDDEEAMRKWIHASYPILLAEPFRSRALVFERSLIGFDVTDVDQTLEAGEPPEMITLLRGRFDHDAVAAAWEANGYTMLEVDGIQVASLHEDATLDLENELQRIALARMNNAAFLPDGTLAYTATLPLLERVIATANGASESLAARVDVAATLATLDQPLASAILVPGAALSVAAQVSVDLEEGMEIELAEQLPPISFGIIGITPGGPTLIYDEGEEPLIEMPPATLVYRLLMIQPGTADEAAAIVDERLSTLTTPSTGQPLTELFGSWEATSVAEGDVLALDLLPAEGRPTSFWPQLLFRRDLIFLAW
ncbi:MAG: hypothetical protein IT336_05190 [Thermomicrobiales bacterium]|nr:hypothetical protein [Thermomicrobiales bacterium]